MQASSSSWPWPANLHRDDITLLGIPLGELCNATFTGDRERTLMKNIVYVGTLAALLDIDPRKTGRAVGGRPVVRPEELPAPGEAFVLGYVGSRGARESPRIHVERANRYRRRDARGHAFWYADLDRGDPGLECPSLACPRVL